MNNVNNNKNFLLASLVPVNFLLSLLIVFHHSFTVDISWNGSFDLNSYDISAAIQRLFYNISECAVPTFFMMSSYLFYRTYDGKFSTYVSKIRRRFFSLFIPYLIFCTLGYFKSLFNYEYGVIECVKTWAVSLWECNTLPLWFIRELMILSLLAPIVWVVKKRGWLCAIVSLASFFLSCLGFIPYDSFLYWIPVYLIGASLKEKSFYKINFLLNKKVSLTLAMVFVLIHITFAWFLPNGVPREEVSYLQNSIYVIYRIFTPFSWLIIMWMLNKFKIKEKEYMKFSFFVYCSHWFVIVLLVLVLNRLIVGHELFKYLVIVFITYVSCVLMGITLKRYTPRIWSILNGRRV